MASPYPRPRVGATQADRAEFEHYRTNLDRLTLVRHDTRPACEIFNRFMERLQQRVAYADEMLKNEKFSFDTDERIMVNRHEMPYPKDLAEAKQLWRERLRFEYLQERLGRMGAKKKADTTAAKSDPSTQKPLVYSPGDPIITEPVPEKKIEAKVVQQAIKDLGINPEKANPAIS